MITISYGCTSWALLLKLFRLGAGIQLEFCDMHIFNSYAVARFCDLMRQQETAGFYS